MDIQYSKSVDMKSSEENGLNIITNASPKMGQDQVSGGVGVLCWLAAPVTKCSIENICHSYTSNSCSCPTESRRAYASPIRIRDISITSLRKGRSHFNVVVVARNVMTSLPMFYGLVIATPCHQESCPARNFIG